MAIGTRSARLLAATAAATVALFCSASGTPSAGVGEHNINNSKDYQGLDHERTIKPGQHQQHRHHHHHQRRGLGTSLRAAERRQAEIVSGEIGDPAAAAPEQVHIALGVSGSKGEYAMTVSWATWPETRSQVLWGEAQDQLGNLAEGSSTTYSTHHPGRTDYTSGFLHSATLQGLQPSTAYYYSCGDEASALSSTRSFVTPPRVGGDQAVTFGVFGDLGQTDDSAATLAAVDEDASLDLVLHAGDLSYADCDQPRWDSFMRMLDPVASHLPWMVVAGNHEIEAGSTGGKPFVAYENRFRMPAIQEPVQSYTCAKGGGLDGLDGAMCGEGLGADEAELAAIAESDRLVALGGGPAGKFVGAAIRDAARGVREALSAAGQGEGEGEGEGEDEDSEPVSCCPTEWSGTYDYGNSFYSFDVGAVHVVGLNPYAATGENSAQVDWLRKDLESTDRTLTPWVVVMMHCPWYNSNLAHQGERQAETAMRAIEPIFYEHKVAVVIAGHVHAYERSHPVVDFGITEDGPVYLVVGGAGNREGHAAEFYPTPEWSAFRDGKVYGSGRLSVQGSSLALWEWTASGETAGLHDVAWISNPYSPYTPGDAPAAPSGEASEQGQDAAGDLSGDKSEKGRIGAQLSIPGLTKRRSRFAL